MVIVFMSDKVCLTLGSGKRKCRAAGTGCAHARWNWAGLGVPLVLQGHTHGIEHKGGQIGIQEDLFAPNPLDERGDLLWNEDDTRGGLDDGGFACARRARCGSQDWGGT
jgi:hypothetical protein